MPDRDYSVRSSRGPIERLDELVLAYATTLHKSQGSEYPAVVIPPTTQHYPML
jgi:exodeoxyribonuclease V alpha subunit